MSMSGRTPEDVITHALAPLAIAPAGNSRALAGPVMSALSESGYAVVDTLHLSAELESARAALDGDSNDAEHEALSSLVEIMEGFLR
jgi:hypothetical protein